MRYLLTQLPSLNVQPDVKAALNKAAKASGLSREQVVDRVNELARRFGLKLGPRGLSSATLDKWLDPNDAEHRLPLEAVNLLAHVLEDFSPLDVLAASHGVGLRVIGPEDAAILAAAKREEQIRELRREINLVRKHGPSVLPQIEGKKTAQKQTAFCCS